MCIFVYQVVYDIYRRRRRQRLGEAGHCLALLGSLVLVGHLGQPGGNKGGIPWQVTVVHPRKTLAPGKPQENPGKTIGCSFHGI